MFATHTMKRAAGRVACGAGALGIAISAMTVSADAQVQSYSGRGCESLAVYETVVATRDAAYEKARFDALEKAGVNLAQLLKVEDFVLTKQETSAASAGTLSNIQIIREYKDESGQNFCVELTADADPTEMRQQLKDREKFAEALRRRNQFIETPAGADCASEIPVDSTFSFPMADDADLSDFRTTALANARLEAISSAQYTVVNSLPNQNALAGDENISDRYVQRMRARSQGQARASIWRQQIADGESGQVAKFDVISLVCVPKNPDSLPMPVFVAGVNDENGDHSRELSALFADYVSRNPQIYLVNDQGLAEIIMSAEVQRNDQATVRLGAGGRLPPGTYERVTLAVAGQGQDSVTGKSFAESVSRQRHFNTSGALNENSRKLSQAAMVQLANQMVEEALKVYRPQSAAAQEKPKTNQLLF